MTFDLADPEEAPEARTRLRAPDLKGHPCVLLVTGEFGEWPARAATETEKAKQASPYAVVDAWRLDRAGIVDKEGSIRISWWRAVEQIKNIKPGTFVPCTPTEQEDRSIILVPMSKQGKQMLPALADEIKADAVVFGEQRAEWAREKAAEQAPVEDYAFDDSDAPF